MGNHAFPVWIEPSPEAAAFLPNNHGRP